MKLSIVGWVLVAVCVCPLAVAEQKPAKAAPAGQYLKKPAPSSDARIRTEVGKLMHKRLGAARAGRLSISVSAASVKVVAPDLLPSGSDGVVAPEMSHGPAGLISAQERQALRTDILRVPGVKSVQFVDGSGRALDSKTGQAIGQRLPQLSIGGRGSGTVPPDAIVGEKGSPNPEAIVGEKGSSGADAIVGEKGSESGEDSRFPNLGLESAEDRAFVATVRQRLSERLGAEPASRIRAEAREGVVYLEPRAADAPRAAAADAALRDLPGMQGQSNRLDP